MPEPRDSKSGTVLANRYRLQRRLGAGGMGEVYEAKHTEISRRFAVKVLRSEYACDPQMQARFRCEAQAAAGLSCDHIVQVTDFGSAEEGSLFLVMELLEGENLRGMLERLRRPLAPEQAVAVTTQACRGIAAAHEHDIIHRDLKPENLFLAKLGARTTVKVLDFGIAKLNNQSMGTGGGKLLGTPAYMSPEQVRGGEDMDHRADVYALGAILYESLTGVAAHPGKTQPEIISHVLFGEIQLVRTLNPAIPVELERAVHKALASKCEDRFQSAIDFAAAIAPFLGSGELPEVLVQDGSANPTLPAQSSEIRTSRPVERQIGTPAEPAAVGRASTYARPAVTRAGIVLAGSCMALGLVWALTHEVSPAARGEAQSRSREAASRAETGHSNEGATLAAPPSTPEPTGSAAAPEFTGATLAVQRKAADVSVSPVRQKPTIPPATPKPAPSVATSASKEPEPSGLEVPLGDRNLQFKPSPFHS